VAGALRKRRDELSHNVFLMLQECNKFREHQSRELMIELLEQQLAERQSLIEELQGEIKRADELLHCKASSTVCKDDANNPVSIAT